MVQFKLWVFCLRYQNLDIYRKLCYFLMNFHFSKNHQYYLNKYKYLSFSWHYLQLVVKSTKFTQYCQDNCFEFCIFWGIIWLLYCLSWPHDLVPLDIFISKDDMKTTAVWLHSTQPWLCCYQELSVDSAKMELLFSRFLFWSNDEIFLH